MLASRFVERSRAAVRTGNSERSRNDVKNRGRLAALGGTGRRTRMDVGRYRLTLRSPLSAVLYCFSSPESILRTLTVHSNICYPWTILVHFSCFTSCGRDTQLTCADCGKYGPQSNWKTFLRPIGSFTKPISGAAHNA